MKALLLGALSVLLLAAACKKSDRQDRLAYRSTVSRNCTGTFLRVDTAEYKVCNPGLLSAFETNDSVIVEFRRIDSCGDVMQQGLCNMIYYHDGWVEIESAR